MRAGKAAPGAPGGVPEGPKDPPQLVEGIMKLFDRWARLLEEAPQEKVHAPFVAELQQAGFLKARVATPGGCGTAVLGCGRLGGAGG